MMNTLPQTILFIIFLSIGFGSGAIIGFFSLINILFNHNKHLQIITDILSCIILSIIYIVLINLFNLGEHRIYLTIAYIIGIFIERKTFGKLFANLYNKLYNFIVQKLNIVARTKLGTMIRR